MKKSTIALIDDHKIVREGLRQLIEKLGNYSITHEFENGQIFLDTLPFAKEKPDLFILDYSMPLLSGIEVLQQLEQRQDEEYKVLLLTQHLEEDIIESAYQYGARGFLHKNCSAAELKFCLDNILSFGYSNVTEILKRIRNYKTREENKPQNIRLSDRELHFLTLVCDERELTYEQIAEEMNVSVKSVDVYRNALFEKFQIKSKVGLVLFSFRNKLTAPFC
ncbi:DNA-binding NarL/FixJ family response regulator [Chryseobacterium defluvii]|uniref:DNA-binding NarL/FixJ family response regulator n=1 Tax=Chryseobacterium defluvii TaxID=160396 RepID=A0A840KCK8_9FLAO|nr:response regulator transcription factor [Chryseobacterium defluvii]MBB4804732.1 DNA-binding NarL/FixJ family response regulator [Chryseobacterium defluvii]